MNIWIRWLIGILFVWFLGFIYFYIYVNREPIINRTITDAIIVVDATKININTSVQLLKIGYAPFIYVVSDIEEEDYQNYYKANNLAPEQFILGNKLSNDQLNIPARILYFINKYKFKTIRIVSNSVAMPRIMVELHQILPGDIIIIPHPILNNSSFNHIISEYFKYIYILLTSFIGYQNEFNLSYS